LTWLLFNYGLIWKPWFA